MALPRVPSVELNDGTAIPQLCFGLFRVSDEEAKHRGHDCP